VVEVSDVFTTSAYRRATPICSCGRQPAIAAVVNRGSQVDGYIGTARFPGERSRASMAVRPSVGAKYRDPSPPGTFEPQERCGKGNKQTNRSRRLSQMARRQANTQVRPVIGARLSASRRSLRQAPRSWARAFRREPRDPGLPFRPGRKTLAFASRRRRTKNPPKRWLGRVRDNGSDEFVFRRIPSRAFRTHKPTARSRSSSVGWRSDRSSRLAR
jgi:hypothetical protein